MIHVKNKFSCIEEIKLERFAQRNNPVIYSLLSVVIGELDRLPTRENPTEEQIYSVIKKMYESSQYLVENNLSEESKIEYEYLKNYIKVQLTEDQIKSIIESIDKSEVTNNEKYVIGKVMKYFKDNYAGQYDGKLVSQIVKEL